MHFLTGVCAIVGGIFTGKSVTAVFEVKPSLSSWGWVVAGLDCTGLL